mmetsp:Transcript_14670/g.33218  ORF Transcript_14670/g.33218 Transcript_14670/m.33218 type:complete len:221 (+) Transcript_14670:159-821(+)
MAEETNTNYLTNPEKWLDETVHGPDLCCIVIFRGSWCNYDHYYLKKLGDFHKTVMKQDNVKLIAWTSEGAEGAKKADQAWGLTHDHGYDMVLGDDTNALAQYLRDDMILEDLVITTPEQAQVSPDERSQMVGTYPHGLVHPAMVWYAHHGNLVLHWTSKFDPSHGRTGQKGRPDVEFLWEQVQKRKHALDHGNAVMPLHGEMKLCATSDVELKLAGCVVQ